MAKTVYEPYNVAYSTTPNAAPTIPTKSIDTSDVASANPTTKPYTNGGWNWGQTTALLSGALGMMANYTNSKYQARALNAQATSYLNQIPLNYEAYRTNVNYMSEENFANISKIISNYQSLQGEQMTTMGASGFDVSSGEHRIIKDTVDKMRIETYLANRSTYLQSFELWRSTEMENARLKAAAESARVQAKYTRKMGRINLIAGAVGTMANVYEAGSYGRTKDIGVKGV